MAARIPPQTQIFGVNAAKIYHIDPEAKRCKLQQSQFAMQKRELDETIGRNRWTVQGPLGPRTRREFLEMAMRARAKGVPG